VIAGALEIIRGVRGTLVHPLLLPGAQGPDLLGYIVIAYEDREDLFDILFVRGSRIEEYASLHRELRTLLSETAVTVALASCRMKCRVYLYALTRQLYNSFLSTFQCAPSLDVAVDGLSRKQVAALVTGTGCVNGILEVVRPALPFPSITLFRFHSPEELLERAALVREGRMLAYDVELNAVIAERSRSRTGDTPAGPAIAPGDTGGAPEGESLPRGGTAHAPDAGNAARPEGGTTGGEYTQPPDAQAPAAPPGEHQPAPPGAHAPTPGTVSSPPVNEKKARTPLAPDVQLLVAAFGQALEEFDRAGRDIFGSRVERNLPRIVDSVFPGNGSFSERVSSVAGALNVLGVFRTCVARATPLGKRSLRRAARDIVRDLYQNHQKLLYRCGVETEVRDCYRILAGERPGGAALL